MSKSLYKKDDTLTDKGIELADTVQERLAELIDEAICVEHYSHHDVEKVICDEVRRMVNNSLFLMPY